jgi:hypothetical protein
MTPLGHNKSLLPEPVESMVTGETMTSVVTHAFGVASRLEECVSTTLSDSK